MLKQVLFLLLLLIQPLNPTLLLVFEALLGLGDLVAISEEETGDIPDEVHILVGHGIHTTRSLLLPLGAHFDRLVLVVRVEVRVNLEEPLQDGILDGLVDEDDTLDVLV